MPHLRDDEHPRARMGSWARCDLRRLAFRTQARPCDVASRRRRLLSVPLEPLSAWQAGVTDPPRDARPLAPIRRSELDALRTAADIAAPAHQSLDTLRCLFVARLQRRCDGPR